MSIVVRAYDAFELYADGVLIQTSNPALYSDDEVVNVNTTTNLIGVHGKAFQPDPGNGILVTVGGKAVSNASWYCKQGFDIAWTKFGFDFTNFSRAAVHPQHDATDTDLLQQSPNAQYIWTANNSDTEVYCTIALGSYSPLSPTPAIVSSAVPTLLLPTFFAPLFWLVL